MDRELVSKAPRVGAVAAMGAATVVTAYAAGIPGSGLFLLAAGAAGLGTAIVAPCWIGYVTLLVSIAVACWVGVALGGYGGLVLLVIVSLWVPASVGWLLGYVARRVRADGLPASMGDARVILAGIGSLALVALIAFVAMSFATDPP